MALLEAGDGCRTLWCVRVAQLEEGSLVSFVSLLGLRLLRELAAKTMGMILSLLMKFDVLI